MVTLSRNNQLLLPKNNNSQFSINTVFYFSQIFWKIFGLNDIEGYYYYYQQLKLSI